MRYIQLAEADPAKCISLWREARKFNAVIKLGEPLPWVSELWTAAFRKEVAPSQEPPFEAELIHFSSGTTGQPKPIPRSWQSLDAGIHKKEEMKNLRWACGYPVDRMAGIQVVLSCEANETHPISATNAESLANAMSFCEAGSATSAMWRVALMMGCHGTHVRQITLGGDAADETLLQGLHKAFPEARITQTYVTSESGVICSWSDGLTGIPKGAFFRRAALSDNGEVIILKGERSCITGGDIATGDIAELRGERIYILGRRDAQINVGGNKVHAESVESFVRMNCDLVRDCRAIPGQNPVLGQHVVLEVVCADVDEVKSRLNGLSWPNRAWRPLEVRSVSEIKRDIQGKVIRCEY